MMIVFVIDEPFLSGTTAARASRPHPSHLAPLSHLAPRASHPSRTSRLAPRASHLSRPPLLPIFRELQQLLHLTQFDHYLVAPYLAMQPG